jgi:hypothetical protein
MGTINRFEAFFQRRDIELVRAIDKQTGDQPLGTTQDEYACVFEDFSFAWDSARESDANADDDNDTVTSSSLLAHPSSFSSKPFLFDGLTYEVKWGSITAVVGAVGSGARARACDNLGTSLTAFLSFQASLHCSCRLSVK